MGQILTKTVLLHKTSHIQTKFFLYFKAFRGYLRQNSLESQKSDYLSKKLKINQKVILKVFEKRQILGTALI